MKSLLLDVEFPYRAYGIPRGGRRTIPVDMRGRAPVIIDVVERDVFVDAVTLRRSEAALDEPSRTIIRTLHGRDGTLWRPFAATKEKPSGMDLETFRAECATFAAHWGTVLERRNPFRMLNSEILVVDRKFRPSISHKNGADLWPTEPPFRETVSSDIEGRRADAQRIANCLAVVEGHIWHRCHDPVWRVTDYDSMARAVVDEGPGFGGFRIDRRRDFDIWVEDSLGSGRTKRGNTRLKGPLRYMGEADVHDPSFFNRNDAEHLTPGFASVRDHAKAVILNLSAEAINTWIIFRNTVARLDSAWSRTKFDLALDTMNAMRTDLEDLFTNPDFSGGEYPEARWAIEEAKDILRRCELVEGWKPSASYDIDLDALSRLGS